MAKRTTIGTDPEFFLLDPKNSKKMSAIPYIQGTKYSPLFLPNGGKVQHDNVALEFATPPAENAIDLANKIRETLTLIRPSIPEGFSVVAEASAEFEDDQLQDIEAITFGCEPDYNAWSCFINEPPPISTNLRSCGGHLHVGHVAGDNCTFLLKDNGKIHMVRMMDLFHGIVSVLLDSTKEAHRRRELYGKAGCYRPTSYGVEYRVMSNFWLKSPRLVTLVDSLLQDAIYELQAEGRKLFKSLDNNASLIETVGADTIQKCINNSDYELASHIVEKYLTPVLSKETLSLLHEVKHAKYKSIYEEWS